jgi:hypothetical protein
MDFKPGDKSTAPRELIALQQQHGGAIGTLSFGDTELRGVLRLRDNVYAVAEPVPPAWDVIAGLAQSDIHSITRPVDAAVLSQRLKEFDHGA